MADLLAAQCLCISNISNISNGLHMLADKLALMKFNAAQSLNAVEMSASWPQALAGAQPILILLTLSAC